MTTRRELRAQRVEKSPRAVVRQSGLTSVIALIGVFSGLLLDLAWGRTFGVGDNSDAFALALRLPLAITAIVMIVANQVLVPTFGNWMTRLGPRERGDATSGVLLFAMLSSTGLALVFTLLAHPLMSVMAPGFGDTPGKLELATRLTQILAWYIPCVTGAEVLRCWLNANLVIGFPAAMALVLNAVAIGVIVFGPERIEIVPVAYVAGSAVQLLAMPGAACATPASLPARWPVQQSYSSPWRRRVVEGLAPWEAFASQPRGALNDSSLWAPGRRRGTQPPHADR